MVPRFYFVLVFLAVLGFAFQQIYNRQFTTPIVSDARTPSVATPKTYSSAAKEREYPSLGPEAARRSIEQWPKLLKNWSLEGSGLRTRDVAPFLVRDQPESIVFFSEAGMKRIYPNRYERGKRQSDQTLFLASAEAVKKTAKEREDRAAANALFNSTHPPREELTSLSHDSYEVVFFRAGRRDNGDTLVPVATHILSAIQGPDYSLANIDGTDEESMRRLYSTILPLGHGGELLLKVSEDGFVLDEPGFDFTLFENVFRVEGTSIFFQEFGLVGVSDNENPTSFQWFPCNPRADELHGCFGAVPSNDGGDRFDLADLGLTMIRYIWIKDLGINKNYPNRWPSEGCDLDALRLQHVYTKR